MMNVLKALPFVFLTMCGTAPATAQESMPVDLICYPAGVVEEKLEKDYGEKLVDLLDGGYFVVQVWKNETTGSWSTLISFEKEGISCAFATGGPSEPLGEEL